MSVDRVFQIISSMAYEATQILDNMVLSIRAEACVCSGPKSLPRRLYSQNFYWEKVEQHIKHC